MRGFDSASEKDISLFKDSAFSSFEDVCQTRSTAEIRSLLAHLERRKELTTNRLESYKTSHRDTLRGFARLDLLRAHIGSQAVATRSIGSDVFSNASGTSRHISTAVKRLDLEQSRVQSTLRVVEQVAELKACVLGVSGSMGAPQDWETAAGYLHRASKIPKDIMTGVFTEENVPSTEVPDPPSVTLNHAAESLRGLFLREFEKAAQEGNGGKVTRFFKLFPLIGKPQVGLDVYGRYICQGVASRASAELNAGAGSTQHLGSLFFASVLTKLFEHIAQIVEQHGALVERHYGNGCMEKVIERLQVEADLQGGLVLDTWSDERNVDRKLTDIRSYAFTFLVQSFLPASTSRASTPRTGSPAFKGSTGENKAREDGPVDMKEIDSCLNEAALMLGRWSLYVSFVSNKCRDPNDQTGQAKMPPLLVSSNLRRKIDDKLIKPFNIMTAFFFRRSVEQAFQLDEQPLDLTLDNRKPIHTNPPFITSVVDDVMYIANQIVEKSLVTSQKAVILNIIPAVSRVLSSDFIGMIQRKMRDENYPKGAVQGALPPERTTVTFLVLINNLDVAIDYSKRIIDSHIGKGAAGNKQGDGAQNSSASLASLFPLGHDAELVSTALKSLKSSFDGKASELIGDGIFVVFKNIAKPRLRPILAEAFREADYQLTQENWEETKTKAEAEGAFSDDYESVVQNGFQRGWDLLMKPIERLLTQRNFEKLLILVTSYLGEVLEKRIWSYYERLSDFGAVRLERDIAGVVNIAIRSGKYILREMFARCTQICMVMNMEEEEWDQVKNSVKSAEDSPVHWQLDANERSRARAMVGIREA